jgi:hypothetical protein
MIIRGMDLTQFQRVWTVADKAPGRPAGELLNELAEQIGLQIDASGLTMAAAKQPPASGGKSRAKKPASDPLATAIDIDLNGMSVLGAIEAVCQAIGCQPVYPDLYTGDPHIEPPIALKKGRRKLPVATAGPYLVWITALKEQAPKGIGMLKMEARAHGMPREALLREWVGDVNAHPFVVESVTGPDGEDTLDPARQGRRAIPNVTNRSCIDWFEGGMRGLTSAVETLRIAGSISFPLARQVVVGEWTDLKEGATLTVADVALSVQTFNVTTHQDPSQTKTYLDVGCGEFPVYRVQCIPLDAQGQSLPVVRGLSTQNNARLAFTGPLATLRVHIVTDEIDARYPFTLDVPLARAADQQPRKTSLPVVDGPLVSVEILAAETSKKATKPTLRVVNHTDQDIRKYTFAINYFAAGNDFEDSDMVEIDGFNEKSNTWRTVLKAGETIERALKEHNPSPATVQTYVEIDEVEFMNGHTWKPKG